jgi:hypothetical protein
MAGKYKKFSQLFLDDELPSLCYFDPIEYHPEDGGESLFAEQPEDNLLFVLQTINSAVPILDEDKERIWQSINIVERVIDVDSLLDRDIAIASVFFELGLIFGQSLIHSHKLKQKLQDREVKKGQCRDGGASSGHWKPYSKIINKHLELYKLREYKNITEAIDAIEKEIGERPSDGTFRYWWGKIKNEEPLYLKD